MSKYIYSGVVKIPYEKVEIGPCILDGKYSWSAAGGLSIDPFTEVAISKVIYSNPATIVMWDDGTKTVAKCASGDIYSKETGLSICILKKVMGATTVHNIFKDWIVEDNFVALSDVRRKYKDGDK